IYYHNRGDTIFRGESAQAGDFVGLDDLFTEHPRVVRGMIEVYGDWIDRYGVDGFRIDTARHVNPEFWQAFVPAMLKRARAGGIPNFHIFGEVYTDAVDPAFTAVHTQRDKLPAVLDFAFAAAVKGVVAGSTPTSTLASLFHVDPIYYHNRGDTIFRNESAQVGDFVGLDDLFTEHPRVVQGMIDIYGEWIDRYGVDGFRIDTARHVNPEFWQAFAPAMIARAKARGIPNFHIFGEVYTDAVDPAFTAVHTQRDKLPAVLDFAFAAAVKGVVAGSAPTSTLASLFHVDPIYAGGDATARQLPTFLGNHDMGRFARAIRVGHPQASDTEQLGRLVLGHAMLMTLRGVPTIYSGDEQGFAGDGNDQDAREDMFASKVAVYNDNVLVGTKATTATANFSNRHPLYRAIAKLAAIRKATPGLRRGSQKLRYAGDEPGLFAMSRFDPASGREVVLLFNSSTNPITQQVEVEVASRRFSALAGRCAPTAVAPGSVRVTLAPLGYAICAADDR
ncbi:MAG: alpha-amylase family glycosyl hydrolase, partial [Sphingomicrobium sp.]